LSLKAGIKEWGTKAQAAVMSEMKQLHFCDTFKPKHWKKLSKTLSKSVENTIKLYDGNGTDVPLLL
jgi:hypothetical protein